MRLFALLTLCAGLAGASVIEPTLAQEGVPIDLGSPHVGAPVLRLPGWHYEVWFEDLFDLGDRDFNDLVLTLDFDTVAVAPTMTVAGGIAAYLNTPFLKDYAPWLVPVGSEVIIGDFVFNTAQTYFTGSAGRNPDGLPHAWVSGYGPNPNPNPPPPPPASGVPEPAAMLLTGLGLIALAGLRKVKANG